MHGNNLGLQRLLFELVATLAAVVALTSTSTSISKSADVSDANKAQPAYPNSSGELVWDANRAHFRMSFDLDPPTTKWDIVQGKSSQSPAGEYKCGDYRLKFSEQSTGKKTRVITYELTRAKGQSFKVLHNRIECKTSYADVYKIFTPGTFSQQNYKIDLPFRISDQSDAEINQPVVWMQQTDGRNTLTFGLLNQVRDTRFEGSTYDTTNGGEAPGIANSYVRVALDRIMSNSGRLTAFQDALFVDADPEVSWFRALQDYSAAVDAPRGYEVRALSKWALNPMWHSWYACADQIDEATILEEARRAKKLGITTVEIDAGWNIPRRAGYSLENEGDYAFDPGRFPAPKQMINKMHAAGQRVVLHVAPLVMGRNSKSWPRMKDCGLMVNGKPDGHLDPRLEKVRDYLLSSWDHMFTEYGIDGLWYDFLELPAQPDPPAPGMAIVSPDVHAAYTRLMQELYKKAVTLNPDAVIILRRPSANLNAKTFCTHVWPMDTPQDYNMNRRDVVYMKTFGPGVLTHACCTSWANSESDENVARQMASIVLAGVPAFSVNLGEQSASHNAIMKAWLDFYERNQRDLVLGRMTPLLPTPPSAALRIERGRQAFFGFFEAVPGLIHVAGPVSKITLVNAFDKRTVTRLEGVKGEWQAQIYDQGWQPAGQAHLKTDASGGLNINLAGTTRCSAIVLTKIQ
jgi:Glycosyl hydrolases family 31 TIM-barrel domain